MISPTNAFILSSAGNAAMCIALPRKATTDIYLNGKQIQDNDEGDAGWRFMGVGLAQACVGAYLADKYVKGDDRKLLNGALAAGAAGNIALFAGHKFVKDQVKPEMRYLNMAMQAGVAGLAVKAMLD